MPGPTSMVREAQRRVVADVLSSGIFDADFYRTIYAQNATGLEALALHFVRRGMRQQASLSPFIDVARFPSAFRQLWMHGRLAECLAFLDGPAALDLAWSTLFDPRRLDEVGAGDLAPLEFLRQLDDATVIPLGTPSGADTATWGDLRPRIMELAQEIGYDVVLNRQRFKKSWDQGREAAFRERVRSVKIPASSEPLVSIVMPVWNRSSSVQAAIDSIVAQSFDRWELIVVDDGSSDDSVAVLEERARLEPRIRVVAETHRGVCAARNSGIAAARGRYIAFLDSDNTWTPTFLDDVVRGMLDGNHQFGHAVVEFNHMDGTYSYLAYEGTVDHLEVLNHIDLNTVIVDARLARAVGGFDVSLRRWVDHDFAIRLARYEDPVLFPVIGCRYEHNLEVGRISTVESDHWKFVVLNKAIVDWDAVDERVGTYVPGRVSVLIESNNRAAGVMATVASVSEALQGHDFEIVIVDSGSLPTGSLALRVAFDDDPRVIVVRGPKDLLESVATNLAFSRSTGEHVAIVGDETELRSDVFGNLLELLQDPSVRGAQALVLDGDDLVLNAGQFFPFVGSPPAPVLAGHPQEDARLLAGRSISPAANGVLMMRSRELALLGGLAPILGNGLEVTDLALRARDRWGGRFVVDPRSVVSQRSREGRRGKWRTTESRRQLMATWRGRLRRDDDVLEAFEQGGWAVAGYVPDMQPFAAPVPVLVQAPRSSTGAGTVVRTPARRWAVKNPASAGASGDVWGDTHFVQALAAGLRQQGEEVVTFRRPAHDAPVTAFDDVSLVIRGLVRVYPQPGKINVLWVISHPEDVTLEELREFDLVFAASQAWAQKMTERSGREIGVLLQAVSEDRFSPTGTDEAVSPSTVLFVGQARPDGPREIVMDALAAGVDLEVWGPRWDDYLPDGVHRGDYLPNDQLAATYARAGVVLNDHHRDMADEGFIANRIFDAVATGARVVSDEVVGIEELFHGAVRIYRSREDLARLCDPAHWDETFPSAAERVRIAHAVREEHGYAARARQLVDAVRAFQER